MIEIAEDLPCFMKYYAIDCWILQLFCLIISLFFLCISSIFFFLRFTKKCELFKNRIFAVNTNIQIKNKHILSFFQT